jgi:hypothetical protein
MMMWEISGSKREKRQRIYPWLGVRHLRPPLKIAPKEYIVLIDLSCLQYKDPYL